MQVSDKLIKPLTEAKYLNADNVSRYRCIMRIFFEHYEKLKYWLYQEEVYEEMMKDPFFADYRPEQCQQDLTMLTEWKNLNTIQDTKKVASIEEFKNKKYRYQMTEYSVEIERLVLRLENLFIEGASLEPTLLERIRRGIERFPEMVERDKNGVYTWWTDLNNDFVRLNQNYQDYIRDLNSVRAEEMMHTKQFLVFKDRLIEYLRSFIKGLQRNVGVIEESLCMQKEEMKNQVLKLLKNLDSMDIASIIDTIKEFSTHKNDINDYLDLMLLWYRDVLMFKVTKDANLLLYSDEYSAISEQATKRDYENIENIIAAIDKAKVRLKANVNFDVTIELMILAMKD